MGPDVGHVGFKFDVLCLYEGTVAGQQCIEVNVYHEAEN
jgi:hypothetical protein